MWVRRRNPHLPIVSYNNEVLCAYHQNRSILHAQNDRQNTHLWGEYSSMRRINKLFFSSDKLKIECQKSTPVFRIHMYICIPIRVEFLSACACHWTCRAAIWCSSCSFTLNSRVKRWNVFWLEKKHLKMRKNPNSRCVFLNAQKSDRCLGISPKSNIWAFLHFYTTIVWIRNEHFHFPPKSIYVLVRSEGFWDNLEIRLSVLQFSCKVNTTSVL